MKMMALIKYKKIGISIVIFFSCLSMMTCFAQKNKKPASHPHKRLAAAQKYSFKHHSKSPLPTYAVVKQKTVAQKKELIKKTAKNVTFNLTESTIHSLHVALKNHDTTCEQLIGAYLERIKKYDVSVESDAPLNAFTELNVSALDQARQLDKRYAISQSFVGPLHCVPVVVKDNINTNDMTTTAGSFALLGTQPNQDAFIITQLRKAGAIILGKGGMDELAAGLDGISSRNGRMGNVYHPEKNPGGSSGGPAIAVSANFAALGVGTDNSGSVRIPAAFNGIVGLRPSTGLISQTGIFPSGNIDGTAGPLARTVEDLAILLDVIAKTDPADKKTLNIPRVKTYTAYLKSNGLQGKRIGIVHQVGEVNTFKHMSADVMFLLKQSIDTLQAAGATIITNVDLPQFNSNRIWNMAGMRQDVDAYLQSFPAARKNFIDICTSNRTHIYGDEKKCLHFIHAMPKKSGQEYQAVLAMFSQNKTYIENIMRMQHLDALLIPITSSGLPTYERAQFNTVNAPVASNAGLPSIVINMGYSEGERLPIGFELIGQQFAEGKLIEMAYAYEKHAKPRLVPNMPPVNTTMTSFTIPQMNNLFVLLGSESYEQILKNHSIQDLKPSVFKKITIESINQIKQKN